MIVTLSEVGKPKAESLRSARQAATAPAPPEELCGWLPVYGLVAAWSLLTIEEAGLAVGRVCHYVPSSTDRAQSYIRS